MDCNRASLCCRRNGGEKVTSAMPAYDFDRRSHSDLEEDSVVLETRPRSCPCCHWIFPGSACCKSLSCIRGVSEPSIHNILANLLGLGVLYRWDNQVYVFTCG